LKKNIKANNLNRVKIYHVGLGSKNSDKPNKIGIKTKRLDDLVSINEIRKYDCIFMKIDAEEYSKDILIGARKILDNSSKAILLMEDYLHEDIIRYLNKNFIFYKKLSPYNSFWIKI
jgi:hypothetical protein